MKNIEITESGLKCDNSKCDWNDASISFDVYSEWLNKACPKCGENVLTDEDYKNAESIRLAVNYVNTLTPEELKKLQEKMVQTSTEGDITNPMIIDFGKFKDGDIVEMTVNSHKNIEITSVKKLEE